MRNLTEVIQQMLAEIPASEESLKAGLRDVRSSAETASPEMMPFWWREAAQTLEDNIPQDAQEEWQNKLVGIWFNRNG